MLSLTCFTIKYVPYTKGDVLNGKRNYYDYGGFDLKPNSGIPEKVKERKKRGKLRFIWYAIQSNLS
jgi:hypothetical protein